MAACLAAMLLFALPVPAIGQLTANVPVDVGTPIRITPIHGPRQTARFESQSAAGLQFRGPCDSGCERLTTTPWNELRKVEAQVKGPGSMKRAVLGGVIGGAVAYVVMFTVTSKSTCVWDTGSCPDAGGDAASPSIVGGATLLGARLGWTSSRGRWETVWTSGATRETR